jgi:undecaprenyl pyrophosphate phosphatase UppP
MNEVMKKILGMNWRTNLAAVVSFVMGVPAAVGAITNWLHHEPADWRGAAVALVVAFGFAMSKDSQTHSTVAQVETSTAEVKAETAKVTP